MLNCQFKYHLSFKNTLCFVFAFLILLISLPYHAVSAEISSSAPKRYAYHQTQINAQAESLEQAEAIAQENGLEIITTFEALSNAQGHWYGVFGMKSGTRATVEEMVRSLKMSRSLIHVDFDHYLHAAAIPNDPSFDKLWGLHNTGQNNGKAGADIDAVKAWDIETGSTDLVVAIVDSGISYKHPDLAPNIWVNKGEIPGNGKDDDGNGYIDDVHGINAITGSGDPADDYNHGSHCAGIIGAAGNNNKGVVGVNWSVKLMGLKFLNGAGSGPESKAMECMNYIIDQINKGVKIVAVNHSYGGDEKHQGLNDAMAAAGKLGALNFVAAGNDTKDIDASPTYPASADIDYTIVVGNSDAKDGVTFNSNWGAKNVDIFAPGYGILSCDKGTGYMEMSGTSMAAPMVAGATALAAARFPNDTPGQRMGRILKSVEKFPAFSGKCVTGGRLNLAMVVEGEGDFINSMFSYESNLDNLNVGFKDVSSTSGTSIDRWHWDFGDGGSSTQKNPSHTYAKKGVYNVTLTVTDSNNLTDKAIQEVMVPRPLMYCGSSTFNGDSGYIKKVDIGSFSHTSGGSTYTLYDDETIRLKSGDTYDVSISATKGPFGGNSYFRMWIDYNRDEDFEDAGEMVFEKQGTGTVTTRLTIPTSVVGGKEVGIRITTNDSSYPKPCGGGMGWGEVEDYRAIFDEGNSNPPKAKINARPISGKAPLTVSFDGSASTVPLGTISSYAWSFGDSGKESGVKTSHTYTQPGTYTAKLTVTSNTNETDTAGVTIQVDGGTPSDIKASDGFESYGWKGGKGPWLGAWKKSGNVKKVKKTPFTGKKYARLVGNKAKLERVVDLTGARTATLKFACRIKSFEKGDTALVQISAEGKSLESLKTFTDADSDNTYREYSLDIPAGYLSGRVRIIFDAEMNNRKDYVYLDDVVIIGTK